MNRKSSQDGSRVDSAIDGEETDVLDEIQSQDNEKAVQTEYEENKEISRLEQQVAALQLQIAEMRTADLHLSRSPCISGSGSEAETHQESLQNKIYHMQQERKPIPQPLEIDETKQFPEDPILDLKYKILARCNEPTRCIFRSRNSEASRSSGVRQ